ncbi:phenylalanine--tRNA ligase subunit beta [Candidatus Woesearchaeota archaeon]|nr:phenylalanine--tRNA ligase subunit beta [Candidatus Woesearchaeota archaeon]
MPTCTFSLKDLNLLVKKTIKESELKDLLAYAKAELECVDGDEITVQFNDTNLPYLWSVEGLAVFLRGVLGREKGVPDIKIKKSDYKLNVDSSVKSVRPHISAFVAKGKKLDEHFLAQLIQMQEKFCEAYGRRREKIAVGVYPAKKIVFPVTYKAVPPRSVKFVPLEFMKELDLLQILEQHPAGKEYAWILKGVKKFPLLMDYQKEILSFPPIINSDKMGKLEIEDDEIFFEATGTDLDSVNLAANIFAQLFYERGFEVFSVNIGYSRKPLTTPDFKTGTIKIKKDDVARILGIDLKDAEVKKLVEMARYDFSSYSVAIPAIRKDIMHPVDVVEDIAIMYGYDNIESLPLETYTTGGTFELQRFVDKVREILVGQAYQEVASPVLSNKELLFNKMNIKDFGCVEIKNYESLTYSVVRPWILPELMDVLMRNKHVDYPQRIFEQGIVSVNKDGRAVDYERIAVLTCHAKADYTEIRQAIDYLFRMLGVEYDIEDADHGSFIAGRAARVSVKGKKVAFIGEINPVVLNSFGVDMPAAAFELNLSDLFSALK